METLWTLIQQFTHLSELTQMSMILAVVVIITWLLHIFKQPIIIWYLLAGIVVWPLWLKLVEVDAEHSFVELFSHLGIGLLLFMVWLWLSVKVIKEHGKTAVWVWLIQILGAFVFGFILATILWFDTYPAVYLAAGFTFSSTIVVVKLFSDKEANDTLFGKITFGVLIVQDIVVMVLLMMVSILGNHGDVSWMKMLRGWIALVLWIGALMKWVIPKVMHALADMQEYLLLIGIWRCLLLWSLFWYFGFSFEIGCLLAWISFSNSPWRVEMANRLKSLRDFFLVLFFINIWMQLQFTAVKEYLLPALFFVLFVFIAKPLLVYLTMKRYGFTNKTSFKTGTAIWQISEFSFLLIGIWISLGHIKDDGLLSVVMFVGLLTIFLSSYVTIYSERVYARWKLIFGENDEKAMVSDFQVNPTLDVLMFGYGRMWVFIAEHLEKFNMSYMVVDHDPSILKLLHDKWVPYVFSDASNVDLYRDALSKWVKLVLSTIRDFDDDREVISTAKKYNPDVMTIVTTNHIKEAIEFYEHGADYVIMPDYLSADHTGIMLEEIGFSLDKLLEKKMTHLEVIKLKLQDGLIGLFGKR